jgi:hypothetical protein
MANLKYLEFQRLIKELQFVESDYLYQSEIIKQSDESFLESVNNILEKYPDLKKIWQDKQIKSVDALNQDIKDVIEDKEEDNIPDESFSKNKDIKKIYREIVKSTHPDKIKSSKLNELYLEATQAYETSDIVTLYKVCLDLMIDFDWSDEEISKIKEKIDQYKSQIVFLESTYTFKWLKSNDDDRLRIILKFIENKIK